jgi:Leucine-rich repeat (LRR) protein
LNQLRTLNLSDNMVKTITGLKYYIELYNLYLKRNRLGK